MPYILWYHIHALYFRNKDDDAVELDNESEAKAHGSRMKKKRIKEEKPDRTATCTKLS